MANQMDRTEQEVDGLLEDRMRELVDEGAEIGVPLRAVGSLGFRVLCDERLHADVFDRRIGDIDLVGYKRDKSEIRELIEGFGYEIDKELLMASWDQRFVFYGECEGQEHEIDVFLGELDMCHTIDIDGRLEVGDSRYALNPSDLLLEKAQIVEINEKDLKDLALLLLAEPVGTSDEVINSEYIASLLADDWGFYHTVTNNLSRLVDYVEEAPLTDDQRTTVKVRAKELLDVVEDAPKSVRWKLRAKLGTRVQWYDDVGTKHR